MPQVETRSSQEHWTARQILLWTTEKFKALSIDTPQLDAQLLICHVLAVSKIQLYMDLDRPLSPAERNSLRELVKKRLQGEPVAYLLKQKHWYNHTFFVDSRVLIPRPETECIIDFVLDAFPKEEAAPNLIFDFCTGSGCLAITLASLFPNAKVIAIDISPHALAVAKENCARNNTPNVILKELDLTKEDTYLSLAHEFGRADIIVANPPYVSETQWQDLQPNVKNFEPKLALTAPQEGLEIAIFILKFIEKIELLKQNKAFFAMELGINQPEILLSHFSSNQTNKEHHWHTKNDLDNNPRFLCAQFD